MNLKKVLTIVIVSCLGFILLGLNKNINSSPEDLGFFRAKIDDQGLIQLTIDKIIEGIKSGNAELIKPLLTSDFIERNFISENDVKTLSKTNTNDAIFKTINSSDIQNFDLEISRIEIESNSATLKCLISDANYENSGKVNLVFKKINNQWKLAESDELIETVTSPTQTTFNKSTHSTLHSSIKSGFVLYEENIGNEKRTLTKQILSSDFEINKLSSTVTQNKLDRQLFQKPYAGVLFSSVSVLSSAPFFIARYVQLVTDPAWNRIVYGDYDGWLKAYGNSGIVGEDLNRPHGIDRDVNGIIYVADTGNNRIVVLKLIGSGNSTQLKFQFAFGADDLTYPYDVAWDGAGTPFDSSDDIIWVVDTGNNRIIGYEIKNNSASIRYIFGEYGNTTGNFFEPKGLAVGRFNGYANNILYVADAGNRQIVKLNVLENNLEWAKEYDANAESQFTSLDVDHWGNLYASDRSYNEILKLTSNLEPLAKIQGDENSIIDPTNFHVIFGQVYVQSENKKYWAGYDQAFLLEKWSESSGAERYQLGIDVENFKIKLDKNLDQLFVSTNLTDHGQLSLSVIENETAKIIRQIPPGWMIPGEKEIQWDRYDDNGQQVKPGYYRLEFTAESGYENMTTIKESPGIYLPLYYWEDCGSEISNDQHLKQGIRSDEWGTESFLTIAKHPVEVIYHFEDLDPAAEYEIKSSFYNKTGTYLKQQISVGEIILVNDFELLMGKKELQWEKIPKECYSGGDLKIFITKVEGEIDAMISELWIREFGYNPANHPAIYEKKEPLPESYTLSQNYPNPFNPSTTIEFSIPVGAAQNVNLQIFNVLGQAVTELVDGNLPPGRHSVVWNGTDSRGKPVASGMYFYMLKAGGFVGVKKFIVMK